MKCANIFVKGALSEEFIDLVEYELNQITCINQNS